MLTLICMNSYRTELTLQPYPFRLDYEDEVLCLGSCFAEHLAERLLAAKFIVAPTAVGSVYNPLVIAETLQRLLTGKHFTEEDMFEHNGLWQSFAHHGCFARCDQHEAVQAMNDALDAAVMALKKCSLVILTFGTAWVYFHNEQPVANCHKVPEKQFVRKCISEQDLRAAMDAALTAIHACNPQCQVLMSVSPVRHLRDGLVQNQRSKARLIEMTQALCEIHPFCSYFPAYEIMMDDLRDYRFYADDACHPSSLAVDHIWQQFMMATMDNATQQQLHIFQKFRKSVEHRPLNPDTAAHHTFRKKLQEELVNNQTAFPKSDWSFEAKQLFDEGDQPAC